VARPSYGLGAAEVGFLSISMGPAPVRQRLDDRGYQVLAGYRRRQCSPSVNIRPAMPSRTALARGRTRLTADATGDHLDRAAVA